MEVSKINTLNPVNKGSENLEEQEGVAAAKASSSKAVALESLKAQAEVSKQQGSVGAKASTLYIPSVVSRVKSKATAKRLAAVQTEQVKIQSAFEKAEAKSRAALRSRLTKRLVGAKARLVKYEAAIDSASKKPLLEGKIARVTAGIASLESKIAAL